MRRREFILGGVALPFVALAQGRVWRIAMLDTATAELNITNVEAFKRRLRELGYLEHQNISIEYRSTDGRPERLTALVSDLVKNDPDVIVVRGTTEVLALRNATSAIPVVMSAVAEPLELGIAASLSRPGGNITGLASIKPDLETKRLQHLIEMVPGLRRIASLGDLRNSPNRRQYNQVLVAAKELGIEVVPLDVRSAADVVQAFETANKESVGGVRVALDGTTRITC